MANLTLEQKDRIKFEKSKAAYKAADSNMMKKLNQITKKRSQLKNKSLAAYKKGNREAGKKFQQQADKFTEEYDKVRKQGIKDKKLVDTYGGDARKAKSFASDRSKKTDNAIGATIASANRISKMEAKAAKAMKKENKLKGGGKIQYRSIGGKVLNGNDFIKMIYD
jgi:hypothetical protein